MTVVQYEAPAPLPPSRPGDELVEGPAGDVARLRAAGEYAGYIGNTPFVPEALRGNIAEVTAAIVTGAELGLKPMQSLRMCVVIKGQPSFLAAAQRGLIAAAGHEMWFEESTITRAIAAARRRGEERIGRITWTMDDAKRAGMAGQPNYQKYPAEMLRARASAALARAMFPDVLFGIPAAEELEGFVYVENGATPAPVDDAPPPADVPPAPRRQPRRRQPAAPPPAAPEAAGPAPAEDAPARAPVTPAPPPDEQPPPPVPDEPLATDAYKRRIFASMRDLGLAAGLGEDAARELRLAYVSKAIGRTVESSNELTIGEASRVIEQLDADKAKREAGEQAFIDELRATFDAVDVPAGAVEGAQEPPAGPGDAPAAPEPEGPDAAGQAHDEAGSAPPAYNEFPDGF